MAERRAELIHNGLALFGVRPNPGRLQALFLTLDAVTLGAEGGPALIVDKAQFTAFLGQAQVGVVFAQDQAVLGT